MTWVVYMLSGDTVTEEDYRHYLQVTREAMGKVKIAPPEGSPLEKVARDFLNMAKAYTDDSGHFAKNGDLARAVCAVYYAHAWLDAGARMGLFDVDGDDRLFTLST